MPALLPRIAAVFALTSLLACSSGGDNAAPTDPEDPGTPPPAGPEPPAPPPPAGAAPTIAYVRGGEIRGIEPDGTGDRSLWTVPQPGLGYTISSLAWRPDGSELAFASDHEEAISFYQRDLYVVRGDGQGVRKITNAPAYELLASRPKGSVTLTVQNFTSDPGPWFIYVAGASEPQQVTISPGDAVRLTFADVADLGNVVQRAVAANMGNRWFGDAQADVRAGATADAGTLLITAGSGVPGYGADGVAWRADGSRLAFFAAPTCNLKHISSAGSALMEIGEPLLDPDRFGSPCAYDWGPTAATAHQLILGTDENYYATGETEFYLVSEGDAAPGEPFTAFGDYVRLVDLHWLPDGSGFIAARTTANLDVTVNLYEYRFATGELRRLTSFNGGFARRFSIAPDGQQIVFEKVTALDGPSDLYIIGRDGAGERLLVRDATLPAWRP